MDTNQMDQVLALRKALNFSKAAEELGVSQPTLTYQIKKVEQEIGFRLFSRDGKTVSVTPAGEQFCISLREIREDFKRAVERGQNIDGKYRRSIRIGLPMRSVLPVLPDAMRMFREEFPGVDVVPDFHAYGDMGGFLSGENDLEYMLEEDSRGLRDAEFVHLYRSGISLIVRTDDPLARKGSVTAKDLEGRTLMVGGGSPPALRKVQQRVVATGKVGFFNSPDHDTTLVNVESGNGVCLAPDFLRMPGDGFGWVRFRCKEGFDCGVAMRKECPPEVRRLAEILYDIFANSLNPPLCVARRGAFPLSCQINTHNNIPPA
ncbi:MAG: LysR family transcriptional regulator [Candidatus Methanomethylophilaceae archaeon]|nr:LysR family transcriptional regulator [Candidatus Methanomethylophilaceae archaeon]